MRKQGGFSLIELLIVVAIILVIAAIATANFLRSRAAAQESAAAYHLKTLSTAEITYSATYPDCGFVLMAPLGGNGSGPTASGILDNVFPDREGYHFDINLTNIGSKCGVTSGDSYNIDATPTGALPSRRYFFTDSSAVIHYSYSGPATASDPILQ